MAIPIGYDGKQFLHPFATKSHLMAFSVDYGAKQSSKPVATTQNQTPVKMVSLDITFQNSIIFLYYSYILHKATVYLYLNNMVT